ncbi:hypothetical protein Taro_028234 [Colocasia esculenta]|uniref:Uncharacterized protein n=1 Tax=Colocasia esculenta TaxID=4460 RepID=A0A843VI02_COLES|nr:hypothetical protein [Colocasia esculenta]
MQSRTLDCDRDMGQGRLLIATPRHVATKSLIATGRTPYLHEEHAIRPRHDVSSASCDILASRARRTPCRNTKSSKGAAAAPSLIEQSL